jgi:GT2 family glycosyltransferase
LREEHSDVRWIMSEENLGYARGLIRGLAAVPADYALIVNPDIVVLPRAIDGLLAFADARPRAGIVGPQLLNPDGSIQDSCRRFYTFRSLLLRRTALGWLFPNARSCASM